MGHWRPSQDSNHPDDLFHEALKLTPREKIELEVIHISVKKFNFFQSGASWIRTSSQLKRTDPLHLRTG